MGRVKDFEHLDCRKLERAYRGQFKFAGTKPPRLSVELIPLDDLMSGGKYKVFYGHAGVWIGEACCDAKAKANFLNEHFNMLKEIK